RRAGSVRARARPRRPVRRDRGLARPARAGHPAGAAVAGRQRHRVRHLRGLAIGSAAPGRSGGGGARAAGGAVAYRPRRRAPAASRAAAAPAPLPAGAADRLRQHRPRRPHPAEPGLHRPARPAGRRHPGAARPAPARARCAHRHLRRARRGRVPDHRRARPRAGRPPTAAGLARRAARLPRRRRQVMSKAKKAAKKKSAKAAKKTATKKTAAKKVAARKVVKARPAPEAVTPNNEHEERECGINSAWERRTMLSVDEIEGSTRPTVERVIEGLEKGEFRVAEPDGKGGWKVNEWLKKAVLLYFRTREMELVEADPAPFWDKVPARFAEFDESRFRKLGARVVPGAITRAGAYIGKDVVLMPSFINIGAHVGAGTMVDTWATVGSCAQVGKHCHLSGGAGIGGVLEPLQATPTIIEDHCFIGARSEVVEGVIVGHHSVIGMGVFLGQSTRIYNRMTGEISYGVIPPYSVVVSGQLP